MTMDLRFIALLPMKGHSERIPRKNLRPLAGRPLCLHVLETLTRVPAIERIVVNTDSSEIAEVCRREAEVVIHERPPGLCGDLVPMNDIIAHDLSRLDGAAHILQTHATNPLLTPDTLGRALEVYAAGLEEYDSLFSVTRWQNRFWDADGRPVNHDPTQLLRTQDLPPLFEENSVLYVFSPDVFTRRSNRIGEHPRLFEVTPLEAVDIDEPSDWDLAEALIAQRRREGGG